jgi:hypothetical protein
MRRANMAANDGRHGTPDSARVKTHFGADFVVAAKCGTHYYREFPENIKQEPEPAGLALRLSSKSKPLADLQKSGAVGIMPILCCV